MTTRLWKHYNHHTSSLSIQVSVLVDVRACGLCWKAYTSTSSYLVGDIANKCAPYKKGSSLQSGVVIYDQYNKEYSTASLQYSYAELYEGRQLELRKEFAQLCIDYLKEYIRI
jgi:hypothetical protein